MVSSCLGANLAENRKISKLQRTHLADKPTMSESGLLLQLLDTFTYLMRIQLLDHPAGGPKERTMTLRHIRDLLVIQLLDHPAGGPKNAP